MSAINLSTGIRPGTQIPLDDKLYFKLLSDMMDLGEDDYKAFSYYDGMQATCIEDDKIYMWRAAASAGQPFPEPGLLPENFVYPEGSVANGIDYSNKAYNFFLYYKKPVETSQFDKILNGNVYWLGNGLNFRSTPINFRFNGIVRIVPVTNKTLTDAHETLNRIDVFAVDTAGQLVVIEGTPAADPLEPAITFSSQLRVNAALIPAASSIPQGASTDVIFDENLGATDEYDATAEKFGAEDPTPITSVLFDSENNPDEGDISIEGILVPRNVLLNFTRSVAISYAGISSLFFRFHSQIRKGYFINIKIYSTTALLSSIVVRSGEHGFDPFNLNYTDVNIPFSEFVNAGTIPTSIKKITFSFGYESSPSELPVFPSFFIDRIKFIIGGENPRPKNSFFDLNEVLSKSLKGLAGKVFAVNNDETGFEPIENAGGGIPEAPINTNVYARNNGAWVPISNQSKLDGAILIGNASLVGAETTLVIAHAFSPDEWKTFRVKDVMIRNDLDTIYTSAAALIKVTIDATNITLTFLDSTFDNADYDTASGFNRGWIEFSYVPFPI